MTASRGGKLRRAIAVVLAGTLAGGTFAVGDAAAESVVEAVEAALAHHPQVYRDQALSVAAAHAVDEAYSDFLPDLDLDAASGYELTSSPTTRGAGRGTVDMVRSEASAQLTQLLFDFFGTSNSVSAAASGLEASNADLQATSERVARLATQYYLEVLSARERTALAEQNLADLSAVLDLIRGRTEAGRAAEADLDQAVSRVALAKAELASRRGDQRTAMARFLENVGHIPGALERPEVPDYPEANDLDRALAVAMDRNPVGHSTTAQWEARRAEIEVARAAYFPRFDLEASTFWGENIDGIRGGQSDVRVLVRMTWALFDGLGNVARTRQATHEANAAWYTDSDARREIREAVRVAFRALQTAEARYPQLLADAQASTRTYEAYRQQYDVGQRSLLDLLDARNEMFDAQEAEVRGSYDILQAHYELLFSIGLLLDHLGVVVFQDSEQYRERDLPGRQLTTAKAESLPKNVATSFDNADWSGEVAVPGALEFGTWLSDGSLSEKPGKTAAAPEAIATFGMPSPDRAAPDDAVAGPVRQGASRTVRREIDGIEVELVPAMATLPEQSVAVLPASGLSDAAEGSGMASSGAALQGAERDGVARESRADAAVPEAADGLAAEPVAPAAGTTGEAAADNPEAVPSLANGSGQGWDKEALLELLGLASAELAALPADPEAAPTPFGSSRIAR